MTGKRRLTKSIRKFSKQKANSVPQYSALLGINANSVEVNNRKGYVYVRLKDNLSEVVQAYNDAVSPVYGLPVIVEYLGGEYRVVGRDLDRYSAIGWGTNSAYLPRHGNSHSFSDTGGGDIVWTYGKQFMPLLAVPSGSHGSNGLIIYDYSYYYDGWKYFPVTGTTNLLTSLPTGGNSANLSLVYLNQNTNTLGYAQNTVEFDASLTGTADIIPLLPELDQSYYLPIVGVRAVTGTSTLTWANLYDVRPFFNSAVTGSSGGGGDFSGLTDGSVVFVDTEAPAEDNDKFFWDDSGDALLLGHNDPTRVIDANTLLSLTADTGIGMEFLSASNGLAPYFIGGRARGTFASPSAVQSEDLLFRFTTNAYDGSGWENKARWDVLATENWSTSARGTKYQYRTTNLSGTSTRAIMEILGDAVEFEKGVYYANYVNVSGTYVVNEEDCVVNFGVSIDWDNELYLPYADVGNQLLLIHFDGDPEDTGVTVYAKTGETLDGARPKTFYNAEGSLILISDGVSGWKTFSTPNVEYDAPVLLYDYDAYDRFGDYRVPVAGDGITLTDDDPDLVIATTIIRADDTIAPVSLADASAANNSLYYSTDQSKLVYKDLSGTVHSLY